MQAHHGLQVSIYIVFTFITIIPFAIKIKNLSCKKYIFTPTSHTPQFHNVSSTTTIKVSIFHQIIDFTLKLDAIKLHKI